MRTDMKTTERKTWGEFRATGLLFFVNSFLQIFGWSIGLEIDDDGNIKEVYPLRSAFRGFSENITDEAYAKLGDYIADNAVKIKDEGHCGFLIEDE